MHHLWFSCNIKGTTNLNIPFSIITWEPSLKIYSLPISPKTQNSIPVSNCLCSKTYWKWNYIYVSIYHLSGWKKEFNDNLDLFPHIYHQNLGERIDYPLILISEVLEIEIEAQFWRGLKYLSFSFPCIPMFSKNITFYLFNFG